MPKPKASADQRERLRYDLVTELSGMKEFSGWPINKIGALADRAMKGVFSAA